MSEARIRTLEQMPISGNAFDDKDLFELADEILQDPDELLAEKIRALRIIDAAIGETGEYDEEAVDEYLIYSCD